jgi:hypothetical protein
VPRALRWPPSLDTAVARRCFWRSVIPFRILPGGAVAVVLLAAGCGTDQGTGLLALSIPGIGTSWACRLMWLT